MLISQNAEGVHRQRKVGNPWCRSYIAHTGQADTDHEPDVLQVQTLRE